MKKYFTALVCFSLCPFFAAAHATELPSPVQHKFISSQRSFDIGTNPLIAAAVPKRAKAKKGKGRFAECDTDHNNALSREEFMLCFPNSATSFDEIDINKKGEITRSDLQLFQDAQKYTRKNAANGAAKNKGKKTAAPEPAQKKKTESTKQSGKPASKTKADIKQQPAKSGGKPIPKPVPKPSAKQTKSESRATAPQQKEKKTPPKNDIKKDKKAPTAQAKTPQPRKVKK